MVHHGSWAGAAEQVWLRAQRVMLEEESAQLPTEGKVASAELPGTGPACEPEATPQRRGTTHATAQRTRPARSRTVQLFNPPATAAADPRSDTRAVACDVGRAEGFANDSGCAAEGPRCLEWDVLDEGQVARASRVLTPNGPGGVVIFSREPFADSSDMPFGTRCSADDLPRSACGSTGDVLQRRRREAEAAGSQARARLTPCSQPARLLKEPSKHDETTACCVWTHSGPGGAVRFPD